MKYKINKKRFYNELGKRLMTLRQFSKKSKVSYNQFFRMFNVGGSPKTVAKILKHLDGVDLNEIFFVLN